MPSDALRKNLHMAHMNEDPKDFLLKAVRQALMLAAGLTLFTFFLVARSGKFLLPVFTFPIAFLLGYRFLLNSPVVQIKKRAKEIDTEILFATRFMLLKIESGVPLFNAMIDASKSYGVAGKYFQEIVDDINLGKPIEIAVEEAREYSASPSFKAIMSQIVTALKTGADVKSALTAALEEIMRQQQIQVQAYGKKMNAIIMFYLVVAVVLPSLGVAMLIVVSGFLSLPLTQGILYGIVAIIALIQLLFLTFIRAIRPSIEL